ncbi:MAG: hypothetical protein KBS82_05325 [Oscillospiraceae bacterium]|nr:hypothetical protein [Candidatus Limimonas egerieequi]
MIDYDQEFDFETEYEDDADVDEALDNLIITLGEKIVEEETGTQVIVPHRVQHVMYTYKLMKYLCKGSGATVQYFLHEPFTSVGYVRVTGENLEFGHPEWFDRAVELADNLDICPLTNGKIQMDFTFHGITKHID